MSRLLLAVALLAVVPVASAQPARTLPADEWCSEYAGSDRGRARACEVREVVLDRQDIRADASPNGGVVVQVWDRPDVLVRARVEAVAPSSARAAALLRGSRLDVSPVVRLAAARTERNEWVSVQLRIFVPRQTNLDLKAVNGGLDLTGVRGRLRLQTVNGGLSLTDVGGDVVGTTTNGGIVLRLTGDRWDGSGLDLSTANGGVEMVVPRRYSAEVDARTRNGGVETNGLPLPRECANQPSRYVPCLGGGVSGTLGRGGPPVRAVTTNGGIRIRQQ